MDFYFAFNFLSEFFYYGILVGVLLLNYWLWYLPMNRIRTVNDVGFAHLPNGKHKKLTINRLRKGRKMGKTPPVFPNGWFVVAESRDILPGTLKQVNCLGMELLIFRGEKSGEVFITDVYCPHLGANITCGGRVREDNVTCPFHEWSFDGKTGKCTDIPYASKIPEFAKISTYTSLERNGCIFFWHHAEGEGPSYEPEELPHLNNRKGEDQWIYRGRHEFEVASHIEDIPENGADVAHLDAIHKSSAALGGEPTHFMEQMVNKFTWHQWDIQWSPEKEEDRKHIAVVRLKHALRLAGYDVMEVNVRGDQIGPSLVHLHFDSWMGRGVMIQYVLPIEPMLQKLVHVFYTDSTWMAPLAKASLYGEAVMVERDIRSWNSKIYMDKPLLVKEDHLIQKHRRWYAQFYSKNSPRIAEAKDMLLQW